MKTTLKIILPVIIVYLFSAYILWNYNPQDWSVGARMISLVFYFYILIFMFSKEIKNWIGVSNLYDNNDELE